MVTTGTPVAGTIHASAAAGNGAPAYPSGVALGDVVAVVCTRTVATAIPSNAVSGFAQLFTSDANGSSPAAAVFWRYAIAADVTASASAGTKTVTNTSGVLTSQIVVVPGCDQTSPWDDAASVGPGSSTSVTSYTIGTQTVTTAGATSLTFVWSNATTGTFTPPSGHTELSDGGGGTGNVIEVAYQLNLSTGTTATRTATRSTGVRGGWSGMLLKPASTATNYPRTATDVTALSDACSSSVTLARPVSETLAASDVLASVSAKPRALAETVAASDAVVRASTRSRALPESLTLSDGLARAGSRSRALSESLTVGDSLAVFQTRLRTLAETVTLAEVIARTATHPRSLAESVTLSDTTARRTGTSATLAEAVDIADTVSRAITARQSIAETVSLTDTAVVAFVVVANVLEAIHLADAAVGRVVYDTSSYRDITLVIGTPYGHPFGAGATTGHPLAVGVIYGNPFTAGPSRSAP